MAPLSKHVRLVVNVGNRLLVDLEAVVPWSKVDVADGFGRSARKRQDPEDEDEDNDTERSSRVPHERDGAMTR